MYPAPLLQVMATRGEEREGIGWSSTDVTGCARQSFLKRDTDYYEYPEDYNTRFRGSALHLMMDDAGPFPEVIQEQRFFGTVCGVPLSGKPDWIDRRNRELIDWKTTNPIPKEPYESHVYQLNIYREILRQHGIGIDRMKVWYFDGKKFRQRDIPVLPAADLCALVEPFRTEELPDRLPTYPTHWMCKRCPVKEECAARS